MFILGDEDLKVDKKREIFRGRQTLKNQYSKAVGNVWKR